MIQFLQLHIQSLNLFCRGSLMFQPLFLCFKSPLSFKFPPIASLVDLNRLNQIIQNAKLNCLARQLSYLSIYIVEVSFIYVFNYCFSLFKHLLIDRKNYANTGSNIIPFARMFPDVSVGICQYV
jgi:hypothetical protein